MSEVKETQHFYNGHLQEKNLQTLKARLFNAETQPIQSAPIESQTESQIFDNQSSQAPQKINKKAENPNAGHRARLKQKFLKSNFDGFHDYEVLELILFNAMPRKDTKPLAKLLLQHFSTLEAVFTASKKDILAVKGAGESIYYTLKLFAQTSIKLSRAQLNNAPLLSKWSLLKDYLRLKMGHLTHEEFHILFLDAKGYLIDDMKIFRGTVNKAAVYPREILKQALECGAVSMILAHNHPSGDATPSQADIKLTYNIIKAADVMHIKVIDHIIVGKYQINSFLNLNLL